MKAILKEIIFKSPFHFFYLLVVIFSSAVFAFFADDGAMIAVFCWVSLYAMSTTDRKQLTLERSQPVIKETIADAHFLHILLLLIYETVLWSVSASMTGKWMMPSVVVFMLCLASGFWCLSALGVGGNATRRCALVLFVLMVGAFMFIGDGEGLAEAYGKKASIGFISSGYASYTACWLVSRRLIGKAGIV